MRVKAGKNVHRTSAAVSRDSLALLSRWVIPRKRLPAKNRAPNASAGSAWGSARAPTPPLRGTRCAALSRPPCFFRHRRTACQPPPCGYCQGAGRGRQNGALRGLSTRKSKRGGKCESQSQSRGRKSAVAASAHSIRRWHPPRFGHGSSISGVHFSNGCDDEKKEDEYPSLARATPLFPTIEWRGNRKLSPFSGTPHRAKNPHIMKFPEKT